MNKEIQPIETIYNGYKFRSRLEARWAVFFDAAGIRYEYEPELIFSMKALASILIVLIRRSNYGKERNE